MVEARLQGLDSMEDHHVSEVAWDMAHSSGFQGFKQAFGESTEDEFVSQIEIPKTPERITGTDVSRGMENGKMRFT